MPYSNRNSAAGLRASQCACVAACGRALQGVAGQGIAEERELAVWAHTRIAGSREFDVVDGGASCVDGEYVVPRQATVLRRLT